jgi:hypothetical protein
MDCAFHIAENDGKQRLKQDIILKLGVSIRSALENFWHFVFQVESAGIYDERR